VELSLKTGSRIPRANITFKRGGLRIALSEAGKEKNRKKRDYGSEGANR